MYVCGATSSSGTQACRLGLFFFFVVLSVAHCQINRLNETLLLEIATVLNFLPYGFPCRDNPDGCQSFVRHGEVGDAEPFSVPPQEDIALAAWVWCRTNNTIPPELRKQCEQEITAKARGFHDRSLEQRCPHCSMPVNGDQLILHAEFSGGRCTCSSPLADLRRHCLKQQITAHQCQVMFGRIFFRAPPPLPPNSPILTGIDACPFNCPWHKMVPKSGLFSDDSRGAAEGLPDDLEHIKDTCSSDEAKQLRAYHDQANHADEFLGIDIPIEDMVSPPVLLTAGRPARPSARPSVHPSLPPRHVICVCACTHVRVHTQVHTVLRLDALLRVKEVDYHGKLGVAYSGREDAIIARPSSVFIDVGVLGIYTYMHACIYVCVPACASHPHSRAAGSRHVRVCARLCLCLFACA